MSHRISVGIGKLIRKVSKMRGGAGSALPGLVVEKIDPKFVADCLGALSKGVVVVSGTNGKTTTTKMVVELFESQGLKVFTNKTGSNFVRGVISALLEEVDGKGRLDADIAVLELDEAHAVKFVEVVKPRYSLLLNVMRDQLDRFGEIDATAAMLGKIAEATTEATVINREDQRLRKIVSSAEIVYYGMDRELRKELPEDDDLFGGATGSQGSSPKAKLTLGSVKGQRVEFKMGNKTYSTKLAVEGVYNAYNAAAALCLVSTVLPEISVGDLLTPLSKITSAFGRGENLIVNGREVKLILVKNPSGFQLALRSFNSRKYLIAIAINDAYADGRDMSWLWNVEFAGTDKVELVGGVRATDMALRLKYDGVPVGDVEENLNKFCSEIQSWKEPTYVFATYTAMLEIRRVLAGRSIL